MKTYIHAETRTPEFTVELVTISKLEATQVSVHGWLDKQHGVHPFDGILHSHEKE